MAGVSALTVKRALISEMSQQDSAE
jgi:hypothetical protein